MCWLLSIFYKELHKRESMSLEVTDHARSLLKRKTETIFREKARSRKKCFQVPEYPKDEDRLMPGILVVSRL